MRPLATTPTPGHVPRDWTFFFLTRRPIPCTHARKRRQFPSPGTPICHNYVCLNMCKTWRQHWWLFSFSCVCPVFSDNESRHNLVKVALDRPRTARSGVESTYHGPVSRKPRKLFGPVKPFLVHLYLKTERCIPLKLPV